MTARLLRAGLIALALGVAGCTESTLEVSGSSGNANAPLPQKIVQVMASKSMARGSPIVARVFKEENKVEIWKQKTNGRYDLLASYEICKMSGKLGPKFIEGDRQSPEGFYTVRPHQMNPNSRYHLAFNIGYPNAYDRIHGRTGSNLMVHGACSSSGCFSMNNSQMTEIYAIARESFKGGQTEFQIQSFPFRMTAANMARYRDDPNYTFWKNLKEGYDYFEITKTPPKVDVCEKRYVFNAAAPGQSLTASGACPAVAQPDSLRMAYQTYQTSYDAAFSHAMSASDKQPPKPAILGIQEAKLVSDWTKRRARGERVTVEPPSMTATGSIVQTSRMGRIDSPAGRKMAALDAAEAEKKRIAEEKAAAKRQAEQEKAAAKAAELAAAEAAKNPPPPPPVEAVVAAPEEKPGLLGRVGKRITNMFGS
ncbi:murein L,D-transpeptidase family protein [Mesorhizobium sp. LHD-90]|uniref:murein L,D-transpeptidase family protein n=1 Tax=Mesorhizobium sp. LHD-90 TaxID=3071414 RepID=UPI0027E20A11|nr:murein L,D-transpeptidase family protein [Mesorhizobium sp. LHD-90]MDQ6432606.1 murein L,D-transpeptidase family protein [Mesorhizobium sp. LHD-90]